MMPLPIAIDWVAFGGVAQLLAALATIGLAWFTWRLARSTHALSRDTKALAVEAETDRELACRPQLSVIFPGLGLGPTGDPQDMHLQVLNAGGGPALSCKVVARCAGDVVHTATWAVGDLVPSGSTGVVEATFEPGGGPEGALEHSGSRPDRAPDLAIFCSDVLDRRWRFPVKLFGPTGATGSISRPEDRVLYPGEVAPSGGSDDHSWSTNSDLFGSG
jgi:hypothetical protein